MTYSVYLSQQQKLISKKPTKRKLWSIILTAISEIKRRKRNSKRSMKLIKLSEMQAKKRTMTNSALQNEIHSVGWVAIHLEDNTVVQAVRAMVDSKIYSHSSVGWVADRDEAGLSSI
jgi:hypothetical protein